MTGIQLRGDTVNVSRKVRAALMRADRAAGMLRVAGEFPHPPPANGETQLKRKITKDFDFNPKALKPMSRMLWAMSVSLGHALTAYRQFTKVKSATLSPDGMLGGRGYVMTVKEVRKRLYEACEALSAISDTIHDELNAPHWKPKLADLGANEVEDIKKLISDATKKLDHPEEEAEEGLDSIEEENDGPGGTPKDVRWSEYEGKDQDSSGLPEGGDAETVPRNVPWKAPQPKNASTYTYFRANSSLPVNTLPGPRVDHLDRAEGMGPYGSYNDDEPTDQDWNRKHDQYDYTSEWENELTRNAAGHWGESAIPGKETDPTRTEGYDFGLGFGAKGQGAGGYGEKNPDSGSYGVFGPASGLPRDPGGRLHDTENSDTTVRMEVDHPNVWASTLPNDLAPPVARSDYYDGPKGNVISETALPGDEGVSYTYDKDLPNVGQKFERTDNPYIKWDYTTHQYRPDHTYQRTGGTKTSR